MTSKQWTVYLLECSDGTMYCGITNDLDRRLKEHNFGKRGAKYTRSRRPVKIFGSFPASSRSDAQKSEMRIKKMKRKDKLRFFLDS